MPGPRVLRLAAGLAAAAAGWLAALAYAVDPASPLAAPVFLVRLRPPPAVGRSAEGERLRRNARGAPADRPGPPARRARAVPLAPAASAPAAAARVPEKPPSRAAAGPPGPWGGRGKTVHPLVKLVKPFVGPQDDPHHDPVTATIVIEAETGPRRRRRD